MHQNLADLVLVLHAVFVGFVILGLLLTLAGGIAGWPWIRNLWFRLVHLVAIGVVVAQSWFGLVCPLTTLEMWLRRQAGTAAYEGSFIQHWLQRLLYYTAPDWVFIGAYSLFGLLVVGTWLVYPPRRSGRGWEKSEQQ